jgi:hypothetical protein
VVIEAFQQEIVTFPTERVERLEWGFQEFRKQHQEYKAAVEARDKMRDDMDKLRDHFAGERAILWGIIGILLATAVAFAIAFGVCLAK